MTWPSDVPRTVTAGPTFSVLVARIGPNVLIGIVCAPVVLARAARRRSDLRIGEKGVPEGVPKDVPKNVPESVNGVSYRIKKFPPSPALDDLRNFKTRSSR